MPQTFFVPYYVQFVQSPKYLMILHEYLHLYRVIPSTARRIRPIPIRSGWATRSANGRATRSSSIPSASRRARSTATSTTESAPRRRTIPRPNSGTLEYEAVIEDPNVFAGPWLITRTFPFLPSTIAWTSSSARTTATTSHCLEQVVPGSLSLTDLLQTVRGCTFDDFLFTRSTASSSGAIRRRSICPVSSPRHRLRRPIVSANMDTITRSEMAIAIAEEGGIGIIDRGFRSGDIEPQVREVERVKRRQHGIIADPHTRSGPRPADRGAQRHARTGVGTLVVVDESRRIVGLLTTRDLRFADHSKTVSERMTPRDRLVVREGLIGRRAAAEEVMRVHKIKKLPLVDTDGRLIGLVTAKDLIKQERLPFATRDDHGRLRVGAAIGAKGDYLERAAELLRASADVIVIDIAHGHSAVMGRAIDAFRARFGDVELIAGNVATADGVRFLIDRGVNGIKVGIGPAAAARPA